MGINMKKKWLFALTLILMLTGCEGKKKGTVTLDPEKPVTITVWHYYNGAQKRAFDEMVEEFNQTVGMETGIYVEGHNQGDVSQLEEAVLASIEKKAGSEEPPDIFATYADTAYEIEKKGFLLDLDSCLTKEEKSEYVDSYLEEGRIGANGELKIFPTAKSSEVFMLNKTDWDRFAGECEVSLDDLATKEGLVRTAARYYEWTDSLTPDVPNDGKAFYGRDAMANLFIIGSMQQGKELFQVENQKVTLNLDREAMKKIWDFYYVPYVKGYFTSYGKFRSDDIKIGKIIALTGSTTSAVYFPDFVENGEESYPIETLVLPDPVFENGKNYAVQQGAGMAVMKSTPQEEYASALFLKWFTEARRNLEFCSESGYLPVKREAGSKELLDDVIGERQLAVDPKVYTSIVRGYEILRENKMYTNKAFRGGREARRVLEYDLQDKAVLDRTKVEQSLEAGLTLEEAAAPYVSDSQFDEWFTQFRQKLEAAVD